LVLIGGGDMQTCFDKRLCGLHTDTIDKLKSCIKLPIEEFQKDKANREILILSTGWAENGMQG
jgi:hypothetical protein